MTAARSKFVAQGSSNLPTEGQCGRIQVWFLKGTGKEQQGTTGYAVPYTAHMHAKTSPHTGSHSHKLTLHSAHTVLFSNKYSSRHSSCSRLGADLLTPSGEGGRVGHSCMVACACERSPAAAISR